MRRILMWGSSGFGTLGGMLLTIGLLLAPGHVFATCSGNSACDQDCTLNSSGGCSGGCKTDENCDSCRCNNDDDATECVCTS